MADHIRARIRAAIATAVTGLSTTEGRVFRARAYPVEREALPGITIVQAAEGVQQVSMGLPRRQERLTRIEVRVHAQAVEYVDDVLDAICVEVEKALAMPVAALDGICDRITLLSTQYRIDGSGQQPVGQAALTYEASYQVAENAPDVAL